MTIHGVLIAGLRPGGFGSLFEEDEIEGGAFPRVWTCGAVGCDAWGCVALAWGCGDRGNRSEAIPLWWEGRAVRLGWYAAALLSLRLSPEREGQDWLPRGPIGDWRPTVEDAVNAGRGLVVEAAKGFPAPFQGLGLRLVLLDERGNELLLPRGLESAGVFADGALASGKP